MRKYPNFQGSDTKTDISDIQNYSLQHFVTPQDSAVILDTWLEIVEGYRLVSIWLF